MMNYTIKSSGGKQPVPVVAFADEKYALAGEFLLAEARSFRAAILAALDEPGTGKKKKSSFSGNAFSLEIHADTTKIVNDITGQECVVPTGEFRRLAIDYVSACRKAAQK